MNKQQALEKIASEIKSCKVCKKDKIGIAVPGEGDPDAKIVLIGEAPGKNEAKEGRPFIGRSGKLLRQTLLEIGINPSDVFITSPVKYLPKHITPTDEEIKHGMIHTSKQLDVIDPKIIVLMGSVAARGVLGDPTSPRLRGAKKIEVLKRHGEVLTKKNRKYLLTLHPAYVLRFKRAREIFKGDLLKLKSL
jgi:uracil-DNA glycosylase